MSRFYFETDIPAPPPNLKFKFKFIFTSDKNYTVRFNNTILNNNNFIIQINA